MRHNTPFEKVIKGTGSSNSGSGSSNTTYFVELSKWGIVTGFPNKPYTNSDYNKAKANIVGINNALAYAYANNFNRVVFPRDNYSICYPTPITTQSNMTIDFNNATFKVMYDSVNRSPFDTSSNPVYKFYGNSIVVSTPDTHIINLNLIGDRIERSWLPATLSDERTCENSNGIVLGAGSHRSTVRYCNISYYMGDSVSLSYSPYSSFGGDITEFGSIDKVTGATITGATSNSVRNVGFTTLPTDITSFCMFGVGYNPMTSIPSGTYNVYFYKTDGTYISCKEGIRTRDMVQIPKGSTKIKLGWEGNGTVDDNTNPPNNPPYWAFLMKNGIADNNVVEYNEIHHNHRGGIFLGNNNSLIRKNYFHDTGEAGSTTDTDGLPTFNDFTRYAINTEDNVGQNTKILDNVFDNVRMAVAIRGDYTEVAGNEFRNCTYGTILYYQKHCIIRNNFFYRSNLGCFEYTNFHRDWMVNDNILDQSQMNFTGTGTMTSISGNRFHNKSSYGTTFEVLNFKDNVFDGVSNLTAISPNTTIDGCTFMNGSYIYVNNMSNVFDKITRCHFINKSYVRGQSMPEIIIRDSYFVDSNFMYSQAKKYTYVNCDINNITQPLIYNPTASDVGVVDFDLEVRGCKVTLGLKASTWSLGKSYNAGYPNSGTDPDIVMPTVYNGYYYVNNSDGVSGVTEPTWVATDGAIVNDGSTRWVARKLVVCPLIYGFGWGTLIVQDSTINWNLYNSYTKLLLDNYGNFSELVKFKNTTVNVSPSTATGNATGGEIIVSSDCVFNNFSLSTGTTEVQSDIMNAIPTVGKFKKTQQILNANPTDGSIIGWICLSNGTASNTAWSSSTVMSVGNRVNANNKVYECTIAGTTGSTSPSHASGTATDGTVTWKYIDTLAVFKQFGVIGTAGGGTIDTTPPNNITNLTSSAITATSATLSWTASSSSDVTSYDIYNGSTFINNVVGTSINITGLTMGTSYTFWVKAKDNSSNVASGVSIGVTTSSSVDTTPPNNVTGLSTSNLASRTVTLNWTASTSTDIASYDIYNGATFVANTSNVSYDVTGLSPSTSYTFYVKAKDTSNNVSSGTSVNFTTNAPVATLVLRDSFDRANASTLGTADTGQAWTTNGTQGISGNLGYSSADYGGVGINPGAVIDYSVEVTFATIVSEPSLVFKRVDSNTGVNVCATANSYVIKGFNIDEGWTTHKTYAVTPVNGDTIKVVVTSGVANVYLNGNATPIMTWTINSKYIAGTQVGLRSTSSSNRFDEFKVYSL